MLPEEMLPWLSLVESGSKERARINRLPEDLCSLLLPKQILLTEFSV